jgi:hypothetical protein
MIRSASAVPKTHEIQILRLRHERKLESQKLDTLKKELQTLTTKAHRQRSHAA